MVLNTLQLTEAFLYDQFHVVGVLLDKSVNVTESGAFPERGVRFVKSATGSVVTVI